MCAATLSLLVSLTVLPITYCALALHLSSCLYGNLRWALQACCHRRRKAVKQHSMMRLSLDGILVAFFSLTLNIGAVALFFLPVPESAATEVSQDAQDPFVQLFIGVSSVAETRYSVGLAAAMLSGVSFSVAHSIAKSKTMTGNGGTRGKRTHKMMASLTVSLLFASLLFFTLAPKSQQTS